MLKNKDLAIWLSKTNPRTPTKRDYTCTSEPNFCTTKVYAFPHSPLDQRALASDLLPLTNPILKPAGWDWS